MRSQNTEWTRGKTQQMASTSSAERTVSPLEMEKDYKYD